MAATLGAAALTLALGSQLATAAIGDPPEVTAPTILDVTTSHVALEAEVVPNTADDPDLPEADKVQVRFQIREQGSPDFDPDDEFNLSPASAVGTDPVLVSGNTLGGTELLAGTTYEIRTRAFTGFPDPGSEDHDVVSAITTFETRPALPPSTTTPVVSAITNDAATFTGDIDSRGTPSSYHFEYKRSVDSAWISVPESDVELPRTTDGDATEFAENEVQEANQTVSGLEASTDYDVRLVATNEHGTDTSAVETFTSEPPAPPLLTVPTLTDVTADGARFVGKVDPNGEDGASWHFEYRRTGDPDWIAVPDPEGTFAGFAPTLVAHQVGGLEPGTVYEVRLVATGLGGTTTSGERGFTTFPAEMPPLPDRAFEQVTPAEKGDGLVAPGLFTGAAASASGDRYAFQAGVALPDSNAFTSSYVAERGASVWSTKPITPSTRRTGFGQFSPDLSRALVWAADPPQLVAGENAGTLDVFVRDNDTGSYTLLTTAPASALGRSTSDEPILGWASSDLERVLLSNTEETTTYVPGMPPLSAYYAADGEISVASLMPGGSEPFPSAGDGAGGLRVGRGGHHRALSEDGSRIFFSAPSSANSLQPRAGTQLYVRKDHGGPDAETVHVSAPEPGVADPGGTQAAFYRTASADGSKAFFTSCERLTAEATADSGDGNGDCHGPSDESDLYLFEVEANGGEGELSSLTTADPTGADVRGVVGSSEDGSRVYFVATGDLGGAAVRGEPNLYLWRESAGIAHIAALEPGDAKVWSSEDDPAKQAEATPDGRHLAFASTARLTAEDNGGVRQVYLFSLERPGQLACASCDAAGRPAAEPASLATPPEVVDGLAGPTESWPAAYERRNVSDDGAHVFFDTAAAIASRDANGHYDVYEYKATAGRSVLVSTGLSESGSHFAGASASGDDAFFFTREQLVSWDRDDVYDIYDARVGGGLPEPEPEVDCGLDCQGEPADSPPEAEIGSRLFEGTGSLAACGRLGERQVRVKGRANRLQLRAKLLAHRTKRLRRAARRADGRSAERLARHTRRVRGRAIRVWKRSIQVDRKAKRLARRIDACKREGER